MNTVRRVILSNTNNPNQTDVCTIATQKIIEQTLVGLGWTYDLDGTFYKDRVKVTVTEVNIVNTAVEALDKLFF